MFLITKFLWLKIFKRPFREGLLSCFCFDLFLTLRYALKSKNSTLYFK